MSGMTLLPKDEREAATAASPLVRKAEITIRLCAPTPGLLGPALDQLMPLLDEIAGILADGAITATVELPGYHETFYGLESDEDDG